MNLDIGSFIINNDTALGFGTPAWGTALGQGEGYKIKNEHHHLVLSLLYNAVPYGTKIEIRMGKGKDGIEEGKHCILLVALYNKVYFNDVYIEGAQYSLALTKELTTVHVGRKSIKYTLSMTINDKNYNEDCIEKIKQKFEIDDKQYIVMNRIDSFEQDELRLYGAVLKKNMPINFASPKDRKKFIEQCCAEQCKKIHTHLLEDYSNTINNINSYIRAKGFKYSGKLIENFYLSLRSKPFVILAGVSGTGKTRLIKLFAEAINAEYNLIPVRPDWSDSSDLFGHLDLNGHFIEGPVTKVVKKANEDLDHPYFICLDEMNLARVEYYLSDFLSVLESRRKIDSGGIVAEVPLFIIPPHKELDEDGNEIEIEEKTIKLTDNIYVIGTVNMDETTFPFSKKVLDRANTIEFSDVDLKVKNEIVAEQPVLDNVSNDFLCSKYAVLKDCYTDDNKEFIDTICTALTNLNEDLNKAQLQIGYRVRDEICYYMLYDHEMNLFGIKYDDENFKIYDCLSFRNVVMQKILPRIQGSGERIEMVLKALQGRFAELNADLSVEENGTVDSKELNCICKKIQDMLDKLSEDGTTSFWN